MRTFLKIAIAIFLACARGQAQFLGYISPQAVGPITVFNAVTTPQASATVQNVGQSVHYLTYTTSGTVTSLTIQLEGSADGVNWTRVSETATNTSSGALFANVYLPLIRANLTAMAGGGSVTAFYTGTSVTAGPPAGTFLTSGINGKNLATAAAANLTATYTFTPPAGNSGGAVYLKYSAPLAGGTIAVSAGPDSSHLAVDLPNIAIANSGSVQLFLVSPRPANVITVTYTSPGATAVTYDLNYQFGPVGNVGSSAAANQIQGSDPVGAQPTGFPVLVAGWDGVRVQTLLACGSQQIISFTASGNTQIVPLSGSNQVRICHISFSDTATSNIKLTQGTGVNCGTGTADLTGVYQNVVNLALDFGSSSPLVAGAGNAVCINSSATVTGGGEVIYAQF
jgi:hypothetical protein